VDALERSRRLDPTLEQSDPGVGEALGRAYARALEYESAVAVFERNRDHAATMGDTLNEIRFSSLLANAYADAANFPRAEEVLSRAIALSSDLTDPFEQAKMLWAQSRLHALQSNHAAAARYAERALEILEVSDYTLHIGLAHVLLAHIELDRGDAPRAIELLERCEPVVASSGRVFELASLRVEYARALAQTGRREEALAAALTATGLTNELTGVQAGRGYALVAEVYESLGEDERAVELYELAVSQLEQFPNRYVVEAYSKLAALLERRGQKDAALEVLKRAMSVQRRAERVLVDHEG
jgi:tetratricopeptide (TPR) repeat protein